MTEADAIASGWMKLKRGWYHINAWQPHGPYEPVCFRRTESIPDERPRGGQRCQQE